MLTTVFVNSLVSCNPKKEPAVKIERRLSDTEILTAVSEGDVDTISHFLHSEHCDINKEYNKTVSTECFYYSGKLTLLQYAVATNQPTIVELLLKAKDININYQNCDEKNLSYGVFRPTSSFGYPSTYDFPGTALVWAIMTGHTECLKLLLNTPNNGVNKGNKYNKTPLHIAVYRANKECIELLLKAPDIDINKADAQGDTPLHTAVNYGHAECVRLLSKAPGINANTANIKGETPLDCAFKNNNPEILQSLLAIANIDTSAYPALHIAIIGNDIERATQLLSATNLDINQVDKCGKTALHYAASMENEECVKLLLSANALDINKKDKQGCTAYDIAEHKKNNNIKTLLSRQRGKRISELIHTLREILIKGNVQTIQQFIDSSDLALIMEGTNYNPLQWTIESGNIDAIKLILNTPGIDVNKRHNRYTPLEYAARLEKPDILKLLLTTPGIDVNVTDEGGYSILWQAADEGNVEIVELLLASPHIDVNKGIVEDDSSFPIPPLNNSSIKGNDEIGQMFRAAGAKTENELTALPDTWLTMLEEANEHNFKKAKSFYIAHGVDFRYCERRPFKEEIKDIKINKLLVALPNFDINKRYDNHTALTLACWRGDKKVVQFLLSVPGIDVNKETYCYESPLFIAAAQGYTDIVELLLSVPGIDININTNHSITYPYNSFNECSKPSDSKEVMKLLEDARYNRYYSNSSLCEAIRKGDIKEAQSLASYKDINQRSQIGETPLTLAIETGQTEIAKMLLQKEAIDINKANLSGFTPLSMAVKTGNIEIVKLLLEKPIDFDTPYKDNWTPYELALIYKRTEIAKLLEKAYKIDVSPNMSLIYAAMTNNISLTKFLLEHPSCDVNETDAYGNTALTCAAIRGYTEIVQLLLAEHQINVNAVNGYGYTALNCAALRGHTEIVKLLLAIPHIDINKAEPEYGTTPLNNAAKNEHSDIVELLKKAGAKHYQ